VDVIELDDLAAYFIECIVLPIIAVFGIIGSRFPNKLLAGQISSLLLTLDFKWKPHPNL
jgi:hypothetical protein